MNNEQPYADCPCGTGAQYADCCARYIEAGEPAPDAQRLMRSRYSAYVRQDRDYLLRTWDENTRPVDLALDDNTHWLGLRILRTEAGGIDDDTGLVEFIARCKQAGRADQLHEISRFVKKQGQWFYLDGKIQATKTSEPSRNGPCPCGSQKKYKRCCAVKNKPRA